MTENGNGSKKRMESVYTLLGVILAAAAIVAGFWTVYAQPKVCAQSRIEIKDWWDMSGTFQVEKIATSICDKKVVAMEDKIDRIFRMNLRRLNRTERAEFELPEDTINN